MICCKIIADYNNTNGKFNNLLLQLANCGDFLWTRNSLYFCNTTDQSVNEQAIAKVLKQNGYKNFFINVYSKDNAPAEDEYVSGWLYDKLIKINYACYEQHSQQLFRDISVGLDMLDEEIEHFRQENNIDINEEAESNERQ